MIDVYVLDLFRRKFFLSYDSPYSFNSNIVIVNDIHTIEFLKTINIYVLPNQKS